MASCVVTRPREPTYTFERLDRLRYRVTPSHEQLDHESLPQRDLAPIALDTVRFARQEIERPIQVQECFFVFRACPRLLGSMVVPRDRVVDHSGRLRVTRCELWLHSDPVRKVFAQNVHHTAVETA